MSEGRWVQRDQSGAIVGDYAQQQPGLADEFLATDHPELAARYAPAPKPTPLQRVTREITGNAVLLALIDEMAEQRGLTRGQLLTRLASKVAP